MDVAVATANSTTVGDPNGEFRLGPIANKAQYEKIIKMIEFARSLGDLSENAEYETAKDRQAFNDKRINCFLFIA